MKVKMKIKSNRAQAITEYVLLLALFSIVSLMALAYFINKGYGTVFDKYKRLLSTPYHYE